MADKSANPDHKFMKEHSEKLQRAEKKISEIETENEKAKQELAATIKKMNDALQQEKADAAETKT